MSKQAGKNVQAEMALSWPTGGTTDGRRASLSIRDRASGQLIFETEMQAEQFAAFMSSSHMVVDGCVASDAGRARIGREYVHERVDIPEEFKYAGRYDETRTKVPDADMLAYGEKVAADGGWEGASWRRHNYGWSLTVYRWDEKQS